MIPIVKPRFPGLSAFAGPFSNSLRSGQVTNNGEHVRRFERELTSYLGVQTLAFNNGHTALLTMLMASGIGPNDEVIVPSFTFCGTVSAIRMLGAVPWFAEVNSETLTLDPQDVKRRVRDTVEAILGVDVYGLCCEYEVLERIANGKRLKCLFDSAPAFGSMVGGIPTGGFGDAQIFSFHATKQFSTMEGGALCSNDLGLIEKARQIRDFGQDENKDCQVVGLNGKMTEVCALVGLENLKGWRDPLRAYKYQTFTNRLRDMPGLRLIEEPKGQWPNWAYVPVFIEPEFGKTRDEVFAELRDKGVMARKYYTACHLLPPFKNGQKLPITEKLASEVIALPLYPEMTDSDMNEIALAFKEIRG